MAEQTQKPRGQRAGADATDEGKSAGGLGEQRGSALPDAEGRVDLFSQVRLPSDAPDLRGAHLERFEADQPMWEPQPRLASAPPARPGMEQRWVRAVVRGRVDAERLTAATRSVTVGGQGWRVRAGETVPAEFAAQIVQDRTLGAVIVNGDLVLCERPEQIGEYFRRGIKHAAGQQIEAMNRSVLREAGSQRRGARLERGGGDGDVVHMGVDRSVVVADD